ncbi:RNase E specificity factor CsrD [Vibrio sp. SS-MA-C1-2]|uniref:RNase E specificity factor CsrD n=1 Tax=Vibrio sp. SS-MA-C1-2 TaxID=2908646 RepID=UPI001F31B7FD|nr:RNase E specificity factor CsrD [Vibrio sp. SS-MA-C1-2]UJF19152.1 RNase E specificity factor CsrD [Vibrio sp. SS-MA-C1-2]
MSQVVTVTLTNRLATFVTLIVVGAMLVIFVGGAVGLEKLGQSYIHHFLSEFALVVDQELQKPNGLARLNEWIPQFLEINRITSVDILRDGEVLYHAEHQFNMASGHEFHQLNQQLANHPELILEVGTYQYYGKLEYSLSAMSYWTVGILVILISLFWGLNWLRKQLVGAEILDHRGRMLLAGRIDGYETRDEREWPETASRALDYYIAELKDARKERSRFDTFIRTQTFMDKLTGASNRSLFDSQLNTILEDDGCYGAVILLRITDWAALEFVDNKTVQDYFIQNCHKTLLTIIHRYPEAILSRYDVSQFAIIMPQHATKEVTLLINQLMTSIDRLDPPKPLNRDNWCHIGVTYYQHGESQIQLMEEIEMALRSAQTQGSNSWYAFKKDHELKESRGNVRWRTLLETVLDNRSLFFHKQKVLINDGTDLLHYELLAKIKDEKGEIIRAGHFLSSLEQVGLTAKFDKLVLIEAIGMLKAEPNENLSVNMSVETLINQDFVTWLRDTLLQLPKSVRSRLHIEMAEGSLSNKLEAVRPATRLIVGLGCKLLVDQAGCMIVNTQYIKELKVDYIKLHRSLVRRIHKRPENRLFIRSMVGACSDSKTEVIAVGVETEKEWLTLKSLDVKGLQGHYVGKEVALYEQKRAVKKLSRSRWGKK